MILVNVLLFVALASSVVMLMISGEDAALHAALRTREAERAQAVAQGGELSAIAALQRDATDAPDTDNATEAWAQLGEQAQPIEGGTFTLEIADAQSRFNINSVRDGDAASVMMLQRIAATAAIPPETAARAVELIRLYGPISDLTPLAQAGIDPSAAAQVAGLLTALPYRSEINVNSASEAMLAVLLGNAPLARLLVERRNREGLLTPKDFAELGAATPAGTGFTSNLFWVRTRVTIGETGQTLTSLIARHRDSAGKPVVAAIARWQGRSSPFDLVATPIVGKRAG